MASIFEGLPSDKFYAKLNENVSEQNAYESYYDILKEYSEKYSWISDVCKKLQRNLSIIAEENTKNVPFRKKHWYDVNFWLVEQVYKNLHYNRNHGDYKNIISTFLDVWKKIIHDKYPQYNDSLAPDEIYDMDMMTENKYLFDYMENYEDLKQIIINNSHNIWDKHFDYFKKRVALYYKWKGWFTFNNGKNNKYFDDFNKYDIKDYFFSLPWYKKVTYYFHPCYNKIMGALEEFKESTIEVKAGKGYMQNSEIFIVKKAPAVNQTQRNKEQTKLMAKVQLDSSKNEIKSEQIQNILEQNRSVTVESPRSTVQSTSSTIETSSSPGKSISSEGPTKTPEVIFKSPEITTTTFEGQDINLTGQSTSSTINSAILLNNVEGLDIIPLSDTYTISPFTSFINKPYIIVAVFLFIFILSFIWYKYNVGGQLMSLYHKRKKKEHRKYIHYKELALLNQSSQSFYSDSHRDIYMLTYHGCLRS
ncbi:PIR protein [Plasmodium brasilianum]|uniref:PIR protein n=1 Tax=Plasmodium brasilianum TaxID=5824 RepID=A0ACB9YC52_PLABR|nr:PIR protein [Plasmodium brasilianum]